MGCVSSKCIRTDLTTQKQRVTFINNGGDNSYPNHVVSLTSSTYGALNLDLNDQSQQIKEQVRVADESKMRIKKSSPPREELEVINAWELMEGLEEEGTPPISSQPKKSPKFSPFLRGFMATPDSRSPLKFLNQFGSPKTLKKLSGKENKVHFNGVRGGGVRRLDYTPTPKGVLKTRNSSPNSCMPVKGSPICAKRNSFGSENALKKSFTPSPLFDPELVASYEKELCEEGEEEEEEQIKRTIWTTPKARSLRKSMDSSHSLFEMFEKKCPPGGENSVVIYTTTLRGIRKTFEDCNKVRSIIESYNVHFLERDVSMDSGLKEELRKLMGTKEVKVPLVFVKGSLVGGADEVVKLDEEEKLGVLFEGVPRGLGGECEGCGGVRFLMCLECNGSCKVLDDEHKNKVRCGKCNENGIIQCPLCC